MGVFLGVLLAPGHGAQADQADIDIGFPQLAVLHEMDNTKIFI